MCANAYHLQGIALVHIAEEKKREHKCIKRLVDDAFTVSFDA